MFCGFYQGLIDEQSELSRLHERQGKLEKNLTKLEEKSNDPRVAEEELIISRDKVLIPNLIFISRI